MLKNERYSKLTTLRKTLAMAALMLAIPMAGCDVYHGPDGTPPLARPTVTSVTPADGTPSVALNTVLIATFSEAMEAASITGLGTFTLTGPFVEPVAGTVTYDEASRTATFTPSSDLTSNTTYTAKISTWAQSAAGIPMSSAFVWSFSTGEATDTTAPRVAFTVPFNGELNVAVNRQIAAIFSEAMDPSLIIASNISVVGPSGSIFGSIDYTGAPAGQLAGAVAYAAGSHALVFTPAADLETDSTYTVTIAGLDGVEDLAGNAMAADYSWSFTTASSVSVTLDTTAPRVIFTAPVSGSTNVDVNTQVVAVFSEPMESMTITTANFFLMDGLTPVTGTIVYDVPNSLATFTPSNPLTENTMYTATITTAVMDMAGNAMAANYAWSFTTSVGAATDTTAPRVIFTSPVSDASNVALNSQVTAVFSEAMSQATINVTTFTVMNGLLPVTGTVSYDVLSNLATFTADNPLTYNTMYSALISSTVLDLAGNPMVADYAWSFTTGTPAVTDVTAPRISSTDPEDLAIDVTVTTTVSATFSEPMDEATINITTFTLMADGAITAVTGTVSYDPLNNIATFIPDFDLEYNTTYTALISGATDLAGTALTAGTAPNPWSFTTVSLPSMALAINLRGAESFGLASRGGLTSTGVTVINGDVALYPTPTCTDSTGNAGASESCLFQVHTSPTGMTVNGSIYFFGDPYDNGGTANSVTNDLNIAWTEGMNKVDTLAGILVGELGAPGPVGKILFPGVYNEANLGFAAGMVATFDAQNDANAVFIIKVGTIGGAGDFVDSGTLLLPTEIKLINGAQARNIWFVVGRDITIGSGTTWHGNILAGRTATVNDGSTVEGRVLAGATGAGAFVLTGAASPSVTTINVPQ